MARKKANRSGSMAQQPRQCRTCVAIANSKIWPNFCEGCAERLEERAAIMEYEAGIERKVAEWTVGLI